MCLDNVHVMKKNVNRSLEVWKKRFSCRKFVKASTNAWRDEYKMGVRGNSTIIICEIDVTNLKWKDVCEVQRVLQLYPTEILAFSDQIRWRIEESRPEVYKAKKYSTNFSKSI